ncbi:MAG: AAA family ATPase [Bacteroidia bacterium]|nr:AAA family ATPase [Bacteroidia bacterium]
MSLINNNIDSFEGLRDQVIESVKEYYTNQETYIVCDIYARFSVYVVTDNAEFIGLLQHRLEGFVERVFGIKKDDGIYQDLNNINFLRPIQIDNNLYYVDRHIQLSNWNLVNRFESHSHIVCYYSFKGGLGRTTALVLTAIYLARRGKKVVLMDFDLEAPGLASVFSPNESGIDQFKGVVDYLTDLVSLKYQRERLQLTNYYSTINRQDIVGQQGGEIVIFPAGFTQGDENLYFSKLSKINPVFFNDQQVFPVDVLLRHIEEELNPEYILIDTRTGLNELGGLTIARYAQTAFLFFFGNQQNMFGLETLLPKLKARQGYLSFYLVNSPVPKPPLAQEQREYYLEKSYDLFSDLYYEGDDFPFIRDATAPHYPIEVPYNDLAVRLNNTEKLKSLINYQNGENPYVEMGERILLNTKSESVFKGASTKLSGPELLEAFKDIVTSSASAEYEFDSLESLKMY